MLAAGVGQAGDLLPFLKRGDPRIRSLESFIVAPIDLEDARVAVFPFVMEQEGRPQPPNPAPAMTDALHSHVPEAEVIVFDSRPANLARVAWAAEADFVVDGAAHRVFRRTGGGFLIEATIELLDVSGGRPTLVWRARKRIEWRERHPDRECLLFFAEQVVFDWLDHAAAEE